MNAGSCRILFFSVLRDAVGRAEIEWPLTRPTTAGSLLDELCALHPALGRFLPSLLVAVNLEYVTPDGAVTPGDEVAVMPPVQGG